MEQANFQAIVTDKAGQSIAVRWADNRDKAIDHVKRIRKWETRKTSGRVMDTATGKEVYNTI